MWNGCESFWFPNQQVGKCGCAGLPVMQNYEIRGRKIKFWNFFCETKFSIAPNDFSKLWRVHLLTYASCRLLVLHCFEVRRLWSGTWLSRMDGLQMICDKFRVRVNQPNHFSEICGPMRFEFRSEECCFETNGGIVFVKCNRGAAAIEEKFLWVLWSFLISSIIENLNPVSLQQTADLFPELVPQRSFRLFFNAESSPARY